MPRRLRQSSRPKTHGTGTGWVDAETGKPVDFDKEYDAYMAKLKRDQFESCRPDLPWYRRYWRFMETRGTVEDDLGWAPLETIEANLLGVALIWLGYGAGLYVASGFAKPGDDSLGSA